MREEEGKLMETYRSAKKLMEETEELLLKFESENERGIHSDRQSLDSIHDYISQIQSLYRDMTVLRFSNPRSIPNRKLWKSRENWLYEEASSMNSRLQKLLDPYQNPKVEIKFDHLGKGEGVDVDVDVDGNGIIDTMEESLPEYSWLEMALSFIAINVATGASVVAVAKSVFQI